MHAFSCDVFRAWITLGTQIAARKPMIPTTIMISTKVQPDWFEFRNFIWSNLVTALRFYYRDKTGELAWGNQWRKTR